MKLGLKRVSKMIRVGGRKHRVTRREETSGKGQKFNEGGGKCW